MKGMKKKVSKGVVVMIMNKFRKNLHELTPNAQLLSINEYSSTGMVVNVINEMRQTEEEKKKKEMERSRKTKGRRRVKIFIKGRRKIERVDQIAKWKRWGLSKRKREEVKKRTNGTNWY